MELIIRAGPAPAAAAAAAADAPWALSLPAPAGWLKDGTSAVLRLAGSVAGESHRSIRSDGTKSGLSGNVQAAVTAVRASGIAAADVKAAVLGFVSLGGLIATATAASLSPRGPGTCDRNVCERCANIATSVPYVACGCHALKNRRTSSGKTWGASCVAVGCASMAFHGSYGACREWGRRADFWAIAASSNLLTRALFPGLPTAVTAAGMLATPFKPFLVSTVNSVLLELKYLHAARSNPQLRGPQRLHSACLLAGLAAYCIEDARPQTPLVHSVWHIFSASAVSTINHLLHDVEVKQGLRAQHAGGQQRRLLQQQQQQHKPLPDIASAMQPLQV